MSHANAINSKTAQIAILASLDGVKDKGKARILLPAIRSMLDELVQKTVVYIVGTQEVLTKYNLSVFNSTSADLLNGDEKAWEVFMRVIESYLRAGM